MKVNEDIPPVLPDAKAPKTVPLKTKIAFSSGALEEAIVAAASVTTMIFYNQVLGVSAALCGVVFLVASIIDAITDPMLGSISDSIRSRWGRRHPLMLSSVLPLCLGFYLLYVPPGGMSETFYFWWFLATLALLRIGKTLYVVPHNALGAELTDDYHERTSLFGLNAVVGMIGGISLMMLVLLVFFPSTEGYENGLVNPDGYSTMAFMGATAIGLSVLYCVFGTRDQIPLLHNVDGQPVHLRDSWHDLIVLLTSRSYLAITLSWLVMTLSFGIWGTVGTYAFLYGFELSTEQMSIQRFLMLPGMLLALPLAVWLGRKLDKKQTVIVSNLFGAFFVGLPLTLKLLGLFPANDSIWMMVALFGSLCIGFLVYPVAAIIIDSQLADVTDEHEYRTGRRAEGIVFSIRTFMLKATSGLGGLAGGLGLAFIGFPENASQETLTPAMIDGLFFMCGPLYWILVAAGMAIMGMHNLSAVRHGAIMQELRQRRATQNGLIAQEGERLSARA